MNKLEQAIKTIYDQSKDGRITPNHPVFESLKDSHPHIFDQPNDKPICWINRWNMYRSFDRADIILHIV